MSDEDCHALVLHDAEQVKRILDSYVSCPVQKDHIIVFNEHLLNRKDAWFVEVSDVGLIYLTEIVPRMMANLHVIFWDNRLGRDRRALVQKVVKLGFERYELRRVQAQLPSTNVPYATSLRKIGFTLEGLLRSAWVENGRDLDLAVYGVLRNEVSEWPTLTTTLV